MSAPLTKVSPNSWAFLRDAMIAPSGFREYDARWKYPSQINLPGMTALGLGLGTQILARGLAPEIAVGNDYRDYSLTVKQALVLGLMRAGLRVRDIGTALSPMAYFSQFHLNCPAVAMVTASHNPNGWTGVKMGFDPPLTHGPDDMAELRDIVLGGRWKERPGGSYVFEEGLREAYLDDLAGGFALSHPLRVVVACGNGTASAFAPELLRRIGADVIERHCTLDYAFPNYDPNPEALEMLHDMAAVVHADGADLALGFDGDGDRCGVVDNEGQEIFADKVGVIMARAFSQSHPGARFVADVKSTGLFATDPVLRQNSATTDYWKTGHSHMKRRVRELGALAGFEKSGHYFFSPPLGRGYDCALRMAVELCKLLDRNHPNTLADLRRALPHSFATPTMSPYASDTEKYDILARIVTRLCSLKEMAGRRVVEVITVNGARVVLDNGSWVLVRASSNTPNLVVVCESFESEADLRRVFSALDAVIRDEPGVGDYDQTF